MISPAILCGSLLLICKNPAASFPAKPMTKNPAIRNPQQDKASVLLVHFRCALQHLRTVLLLNQHRWLISIRRAFDALALDRPLNVVGEALLNSPSALPLPHAQETSSPFLILLSVDFALMVLSLNCQAPINDHHVVAFPPTLPLASRLRSSQTRCFTVCGRFSISPAMK